MIYCVSLFTNRRHYSCLFWELSSLFIHPLTSISCPLQHAPFQGPIINCPPNTWHSLQMFGLVRCRLALASSRTKDHLCFDSLSHSLVTVRSDQILIIYSSLAESVYINQSGFVLLFTNNSTSYFFSVVIPLDSHSSLTSVCGF